MLPVPQAHPAQRSTHIEIRDRERYRDNGLKNEAVDFCNIVLFYRSSCIISYEIHCCSNYIITQTVIALPSSLLTRDFLPYKKANMPPMAKKMFKQPPSNPRPKFHSSSWDRRGAVTESIPKKNAAQTRYLYNR